jgi:hypothetical protein
MLLSIPDGHNFNYITITKVIQTLKYIPHLVNKQEYDSKRKTFESSKLRKP